MGNRTDASGGYTTGNRITDFAGCSYTTDSDGNVTGRSCAGDTLSLHWSPDGRLDSLKRNNVKTAFAYDPAEDGRIARTSWMTVGVATRSRLRNKSSHNWLGPSEA